MKLPAEHVAEERCCMPSEQQVDLVALSFSKTNIVHIRYPHGNVNEIQSPVVF